MTSASYRRKVRYSDTDPQGIVFNPNYLVYVDDALTDYFEAVGLSFAALAEKGIDPVVAHVECDFLSAGRIGEVLVTSVGVGGYGRTSMTFRFQIQEEGSQRSIAQGHEVYVMLDGDTRRPIPIPDFVREAFGEP